MSIKTVLKSIGRAFGGLFSAKNLTASQKWVAEHLPEFGAQIVAFSTTLASERASLFELVDHAKALIKAAKGIDVSTSLVTELAQAALNAAWPEIEKEALKLLRK